MTDESSLEVYISDDRNNPLKEKIIHFSSFFSEYSTNNTNQERFYTEPIDRDELSSFNKEHSIKKNIIGKLEEIIGSENQLADCFDNNHLLTSNSFVDEFCTDLSNSKVLPFNFQEDDLLETFIEKGKHLSSIGTKIESHSPYPEFLKVIPILLTVKLYGKYYQIFFTVHRLGKRSQIFFDYNDFIYNSTRGFIDRFHRGNYSSLNSFYKEDVLKDTVGKHYFIFEKSPIITLSNSESGRTLTSKENNFAFYNNFEVENTSRIFRNLFNITSWENNDIGLPWSTMSFVPYGKNFNVNDIATYPESFINPYQFINQHKLNL